MEGRALQDVLLVHCYGCGALNAHGLQIKSHWDGDELLCRWQPQGPNARRWKAPLPTRR
jgi:hypothetical protein